MGSAPWLIVGWIAIPVGIVSALTILVDITRGHRQQVAIMNWVYPITGLYWGPVAVYLYVRRERTGSNSDDGWWPTPPTYWFRCRSG